MIWYNKNLIVNQKLKDTFINYTNTYFNLDIPASHPKGSATYLGLAIVNLAVAYLATKEKRYLLRAIAFMNGVCNYEKWGYAHLVNVDLSAAFILFGLSLGYDYLGSELTEEQKELYLKNIKEHANIMYEYKQANLGNGWPTNYWQNHNWINHTALLLAGHILNDEKMMADALANFSMVFPNLAQDGSNYEGVTYWRYGGMWLFVSAWLIKELGFKDYFKETPYLKNTFYYRLYQCDATLKKQLNFGDCHDRYSSHSLLVYYLIAKEYHNPYASYLANLVLDNIYEEQLMSHVKPGIMPELGLCYLAYSDLKPINVNKLPLFSYFPDLGLVAIRENWTKNSAVFSMKAGYPGGKTQWGKGTLSTMALAHHHPDNLSYILTKGEDYFAIDDGYNRNILPTNHNSLLVDGKLCDVMDKNDVYLASIKERLANNPSYDVKTYHGSINNLVYQAGYLVYEADSTNTYPLELKLNTVKRLVVVAPKLEYILFIDCFNSELEHKYETLINSDYIGQEIKDNVICYQGIHYKFYHSYFSASELSKNTYQNIVKSIMTTQEPDNYVITNQYGISYGVKGKQGFIGELLSWKPIIITKEADCYLINKENRLYIAPDKSMSDAEVVLLTKTVAIIFNGSYLNISGKQIYQNSKINNYIVEVHDDIFE